MTKSPRKRSWSQPLADLVGAAIDPVLVRQGFGESDVIFHWDDIVGARLAAISQPIRLTWPPRPAGRHPDVPPQSATLVIRVEGAFAVELQHMADQVLARINAHIGWRCVGRLLFKQGPLARTPSKRDRRRVPAPGAVDAVARHVTGIEDEALRDALARLGAHLIR